MIELNYGDFTFNSDLGSCSIGDSPCTACATYKICKEFKTEEEAVEYLQNKDNRVAYFKDTWTSAIESFKRITQIESSPEKTRGETAAAILGLVVNESLEKNLPEKASAATLGFVQALAMNPKFPEMGAVLITGIAEAYILRGIEIEEERISAFSMAYMILSTLEQIVEDGYISATADQLSVMGKISEIIKIEQSQNPHSIKIVGKEIRRDPSQWN